MVDVQSGCPIRNRQGPCNVFVGSTLDQEQCDFPLARCQRFAPARASVGRPTVAARFGQNCGNNGLQRHRLARLPEFGERRLTELCTSLLEVALDDIALAGRREDSSRLTQGLRSRAQLDPRSSVFRRAIEREIFGR